VRGRFTGHRTQSWRSAAGQLVCDGIDAADGLAADVCALLREHLRGTGEQP
jgi:hypothetical protein